jgi:hypothetical protein
MLGFQIFRTFKVRNRARDFENPNKWLRGISLPIGK